MKIASFLVIVLFLSFVSPAFAADEKAKDEPTKEKSGFLSKINFDEGTFLGDANVKFTKMVNSIEEWRVAKKDAIKSSLDKVETKREDAKEPKPVDKVVTIIHISGLAIALFVFSLQYVFWTAGILLAIALIRKLVHFIIGLFRRGPIQA